MIVYVLLFAAARELEDSKKIAVELADDRATSIAVIEAIEAQYPRLKKILKTSVLAVNQAYVDQSDNLPVSATDEIALIPPVSGG